MADYRLVPKFTKGQVVRLSLHDHQGKAKDELAKKALRYFSQPATVMSVAPYEKGKRVVLVYKVRVEDGSVVQLTEDSLMEMKDP